MQIWSRLRQNSADRKSRPIFEQGGEIRDLSLKIIGVIAKLWEILEGVKWSSAQKKRREMHCSNWEFIIFRQDSLCDPDQESPWEEIMSNINSLSFQVKNYSNMKWKICYSNKFSPSWLYKKIEIEFGTCRKFSRLSTHQFTKNAVVNNF